MQRRRTAFRTGKLSRAWKAVLAVPRILAWSLVFLVGAVLAAAAVASAHGYRIVAVTSGSMRPAYQVGDAVLVKVTGPTGIKTGDVAVFRRKESTMVLHRVVATRSVRGEPHFMTKGDANSTTDPDLRPAGTVFGRAEYRIPYLGKQLSNLSAWPAKLVLLTIAGLTITEQAVVLLRIKRRRGKRLLPVPQLGHAKSDQGGS